MTEYQIQSLIRYERSSSMIAYPGYTPRGWWECDVIEVTKAMYWKEYEIKLSRSDFKADARKTRERSVRDPEGPHSWSYKTETHNKHELLAAGSEKGPSQFWFVTPVGLLTVDDIPTWAGWMEVDTTMNSYTNREGLILIKQKHAPRLHNKKFSDEQLLELYRNGFNRYLHRSNRGSHIWEMDQDYSYRYTSELDYQI